LLVKVMKLPYQLANRVLNWPRLVKHQRWSNSCSSW
jgi:hypothetical protein